MSIEMRNISFVTDIHVNFQLFTMIFSGNIVKDLISEDVHSFIQFIFVLYVHVTENVQEMHVATIFVSFDNSIFQNGYFLHSDLHEQIFLPVYFYNEKSVERNCLDIQGSCIAISKS